MEHHSTTRKISMAVYKNKLLMQLFSRFAYLKKILRILWQIVAALGFDKGQALAEYSLRKRAYKAN